MFDSMFERVSSRFDPMGIGYNLLWFVTSISHKNIFDAISAVCMIMVLEIYYVEEFFSSLGQQF